MDFRLESLSPEQLDQYHEAVLANIEGLLIDSMILIMHRRFARACSVAILGTEELAKTFVAMAFGPKHRERLELTDDFLKAINRMIKDHRFKFAMSSAVNNPRMVDHMWNPQSAEAIELNADYMLAHLADAAKADTLKQDGFYVSFDGSRFHSPDDIVSVNQALEAVGTLHRSWCLCRMFAVIGREDPVSALDEHTKRLHGKIEELQKLILPET